jgi:hypothetical protein
MRNLPTLASSTTFWDRVDRSDPSDCWPWTGHVDRDGYGKFGGFGSHRIAYTAVLGPIPEGLVLDHLCRNRACCNPAHLDPVTAEENVRRGAGLISSNPTPAPSKLRRQVVGGIEVCRNGHAMTPDNSRRRKRYANIVECIACSVARKQRWEAKVHGDRSAA